ncbi:MAG TPA: hypothetical protein VE422_07305 [Terriglobia bacterium]|nr:hypothetical protein [Terriglobia bacterium]
MAEDHTTSLAVWDIPSPVVIGRLSKLKVGARCSAGCQLAGQHIEVHDETGATTATGRLGAAPWSGTSGLYWTELDFTAPDTEGTHSWAVRFTAQEFEQPHEPAFSNFSLIIVGPPDHTVSIKVIEKDTETPVQHAEVRLGVYRASTDEAGLAKVELPKGTYDLTVCKIPYETFSAPVEVIDDITISIDVVAAVEPRQEYWM